MSTTHRRQYERKRIHEMVDEYDRGYGGEKPHITTFQNRDKYVKSQRDALHRIPQPNLSHPRGVGLETPKNFGRLGNQATL